MVMATCASSARASNSSPDVTLATNRHIRVLRWTFSRDRETILCELSLTRDDSAYQLRIDPPWNTTGISVECFDDAMAALHRHATIERQLVNDGWTLESFESARIER